MYIESIQLKNFRNYESLSIDLDKGTNILYGNNAQGKTNVLEAVYLCSTSKSHRGSKDKDIIQFGQEESHIRLQVKKDVFSYRIDMHLRKNRAKGVAVNSVPIKKARELLGVVNVVFFSPEDLNIVKSGPSERRKFLDMELCQLDGVYLTDLSAYNHILLQRNHLLKDISFNPSLMQTLEVWDSQMAEYARRIILKRTEFIDELNMIIKDIHHDLTGGLEDIRIVYEPDTEIEFFEEELRKGRERDLKLKTTGTGPHRDDFCILAKGIDIRRFGSQGQQRTAALSLKLSEIHLVKKRIHDTPVLLLDDVLSELDSTRQTCLLDSINNVQTIITCTGLDDFISHQFKINKVFHVDSGKIDNP